MRNVLDQIEQAVEGNLYYLALFVTLAIPDICGALDSDDGRATGAKYVAWFDKHVRAQFLETLRRLLRQTLPEPMVKSLTDRLASLPIGRARVDGRDLLSVPILVAAWTPRALASRYDPGYAGRVVEAPPYGYYRKLGITPSAGSWRRWTS